MLFNSFAFLIFFPVVTVGYFLLPHRWRWLWVLAASVYFYMAFIPAYILILCFTILIDYVAGISISRSQGRRRKLFLVMSLCANIGVLAFFKYFNFLNANLEALAQFLRWNYPIEYLGILLPIGLSFHTFQSMSYTIEVYKGRYPPERHIGMLALYVLFFPQLVAGPIERPQRLLPQFYVKHDFDSARVTDGLRLMLWGFFKKIVIADQLALFVNPVYNNVTAYGGGVLVLATVLFAYQIYCDFSGYTDIARGAARVMGIELVKNFEQPYLSTSVADFWHRWHMSLSSWFRDYVYIPLGGNRVAPWRWYFNILVTFLISGLWHGASWTFVIWGGLNGIYLLAEIWTAKLRARFNQATGLDKHHLLHTTVQVVITFVLVCFSWVFFRANNLSDAVYVITHLFRGWNVTTVQVAEFSSAVRLAVLVALAAIIFMETVEWLQRTKNLEFKFLQQPVWLRWASYYALVMCILLFGNFSQQQFIYFQF
jgi:alginate O-acetyltransferase complex protein AlgI